MTKPIISAAIIGTFLCNNAALAAGETPRAVPVLNAESLLYPGSEVRAKVTKGLEDARILDELHKRGVDKAEVKNRLAAMTDRELVQIQNGVHRQAGGEVVVIGAGVVLLVLLLILLLTPGHHDEGGANVTVVK